MTVPLSIQEVCCLLFEQVYYSSVKSAVCKIFYGQHYCVLKIRSSTWIVIGVVHVEVHIIMHVQPTMSICTMKQTTLVQSLCTHTCTRQELCFKQFLPTTSKWYIVHVRNVYRYCIWATHLYYTCTVVVWYFYYTMLGQK